jgi:hypothetical protein
MDNPDRDLPLSLARALKCGDEIGLHIIGEVIAVEPAAGGKRVKVRLSLVDQRNLEYLDDGKHD